MTGIDPLARRVQIPSLVEQALLTAGVVNVFPTPLEEVEHAVGITQVVDIADLPPVVAAQKPRLWKRLLGAIMFKEKTIFVDFSQGEQRSNFTEAHETAHQIIPWHEDAFLLDHEETLFKGVKDRLEAEAYYGGSLIIFQNHRFHERALDHKRSLETPIALAPDFRASMHATIRHYVEGHPDPVALIITGRYRTNGSLPVWTATESDRFRAEFGPAGALLPAGGLPYDERGGPLAAIAEAALQSPAELPRRAVRLRNLRRETRPFLIEGFYNQHCLFLMLSPRERIRTGKRVAVRVVS
jgi:hypothetical protein